MKKITNFLTVYLIIFVNFHTIMFATTQTRSQPNYSIFESLITLLPPFLFKNISDLKYYIRGDKFSEYKLQNGDLEAVDEIYRTALHLTRGNTGIALLICTFATLDHYTLGIKIPIFNIYIPLTDETKEEYKQRVNNLPTQIYTNSPKTQSGDRDKLQHFFGSAFLVYVLESQTPANTYSEFIEKFEERYIKNGNYDLRDLIANEDGQRFGLQLSKNQNTLPSDILKK